MIIKQLNLKIFFIGLIVICCYSCVDEYDCNGFDTNHPILDIAVSTDLSEKLTFENDSGDQIELEKHVFGISEPEIERCGGFSDRHCNCLTRMEIRYWDSTSKFYFVFEIWDDKAVDNSYHYTDYSFVSGRIIKNFYNIEYDNISGLIDSLTINSIDYNNQTYYDIIEFSDTTDTNSGASRIWIKPKIGLFKFWKNNICWTLKK